MMEAGSVVRAVFDFCPSVSEELPLFVGDVIEVLAVIDEFWLLGKKEGVTGGSQKACAGLIGMVGLEASQHEAKLRVCGD